MKKILKRYTSLANYIAFLRRQSKHMQHVYALTIAGVITAGIASVILYVDYGFWHEQYKREDTLSIVEDKSVEVSESPSEMMSKFFQEAKVQIQSINT
jgi:hypothetical protein